MKRHYSIGVALASVGLFSVLFLPTSPLEAARFNNENWHTLPHPSVLTFTVHADGSAEGLTETGIPFSQVNVPNEAGVRVQRFEIEDHYHYILADRIIYSDEELLEYLRTR